LSKYNKKIQKLIVLKIWIFELVHDLLVLIIRFVPSKEPNSTNLKLNQIFFSFS